MQQNNFYNDKKNVYSISGSRLSHILSLIDGDKLDILDIGCGRGVLAQELVRLGHKVSGVDISDEALNEAKEWLSESYCFDIQGRWPEEIKSKKFDLVIASEVIEHIFDPVVFLNNIKGILNKDGKVIITTPNILFWKNRFKIFFGKFEYTNSGLMDFGHIRFLTIKSARKYIKQSGLKIEKENHLYPNFYKRKLNFIGNIFPGLFAYQMIFLLKK